MNVRCCINPHDPNDALAKNHTSYAFLVHTLHMFGGDMHRLLFVGNILMLRGTGFFVTDCNGYFTATPSTSTSAGSYFCDLSTIMSTHDDEICSSTIAATTVVVVTGGPE